MLDQLRNALREAISATFQVEVSDEELRFQNPRRGMGDTAFCCIPLASRVGASPNNVALKIASQLLGCAAIESATVAGAYINIFATPDTLFHAAIREACAPRIATPSPERIMVEYLSPNTNKPLHLGHVRNGVLGSATANLLQAVGHAAIRANLVNDRGIHISKSMLAYQRFGNGITPETSRMKGDFFVGQFYVDFERRFQVELTEYLATHEDEYRMWRADHLLDRKGRERPEGELWTEYLESFQGYNFGKIPLGKAAQEMLKAWEDDSPKVVALWKRMNEWVYVGFADTYATYGFRFDATYHESDLYRLGKDIVDQGLSSGVFQRHEDGAIIFPLSVKDYGFDQDGKQKVATVLRANGTSVYLTQDLGTAARKADDYHLDRSLYVVACEQNLHFKVLFNILQALGYPWAQQLRHLSYEMVELPSGKMKSREGTVVDADDLADSMAELAAEIIREKNVGLDEAEVTRRARVIGMAAIKFYLLRFNPQSKILFDPAKSLSFEGDTGPYCLYTYARIRSVVRRAGEKGLHALSNEERFRHLGTEEERALARTILSISESVRKAAETYNPSLLASRVLELCQEFNSFYKTHPIIGDDTTLSKERLALAEATAKTLRFCLTILGIEVLEEM